MEATTLSVEVTEEDTLLEVLNIADPRDPFSPRKLIREWVDTRHYRDLEVRELLPGERPDQLHGSGHGGSAA